MDDRDVIKRVIGIIAFAALALAGCGATGPPSAMATAEAVIHIVNRSDTALVVGPGFTIPACGSASATREAYEAARMQVSKIADGTWQVPVGALLWDSPAFAGPDARTDITMIISGTAPLAVLPGVPSEADLPACSGSPVGVGPEVVTPLP